MPVTKHKRLPDRGGGQALGSPDVEHLALGTEDRRNHVGVAGELSDSRDRKPVARFQRRDTGHRTQGVVIDRDHDSGLCPVGVGQHAVDVMQPLAGLDQGVPGACAVVAGVAGRLSEVGVGAREWRGEG